MAQIQLVNINKNFKETKALKNINLTFEKNKIYGLLGRNGAGKTTLLNIISNRIFPTSGNIIYGENKISQFDGNLSDFYVMGEQNYYPEGERVKEIFNWTKEFYENFDMDLALKLSEDFNLNTSKKFKSLSTGYQTIVKDIIALSVNSPYVFFDEPVLGLDANHRDMFYKHLLESYLYNQSTYVISTHLIDEVANLIEKIIILDEGKIIRNTTCEKLLNEGYTVSGTSTNVDAFVKDKKVIGEDVLGNMKASYVLSSKQLHNTYDNIEISKINLQKLFIELTKKGGK